MVRPFRSALLLLSLAALVLTGGCAALSRRLTVQEFDTPATRELVTRISKQNSDLQGFKGIGKLRLQQPEGGVSLRAAWMGVYPDRLRIELINAGQPVAKLAVDGHWFYLISHAEDRFHKMESADPSLKRLVDVPVRAGDMIALLSGRIPLAPFHHADMKKSEGQWLLVLKHWGRTVQRLFLDDEGKRVVAIERFSAHESFRYKATLTDIREVDGYAIPFGLRFSAEPGTGFSLAVDRYWADADIDYSRFSLRPVQSSTPDRP